MTRSKLTVTAACVGLFALVVACGLYFPAARTTMASTAEPALTIYNQNFALVRETLPLDLKAGANPVRFAGVTAHLEPDSVILRDPAGRHTLQILEQSYRGDAVSQGLLLALYEGKSIEFSVPRPDGPPRVVTGKIIRSGYVPHTAAMYRYGSQYQMAQSAMVTGGSGQPIVQVDGKLQFDLPGKPIFPALSDDTVLKPSLDWILHSGAPAKFDAELSYVSGGMTWEADYNVVAPETGDVLDLVGWVTIDNQSGKQFDHARIKLVAGDVSRVRPAPGSGRGAESEMMAGRAAAPQVTERTFDEYHLYTLPRPTTIHDRETKQVEFLRASGIQSRRLYIYDGAQIDSNRYGWTRPEDIRNNAQYGTQSNPKVWVMREFVNTAANHLGLPLPKGRVRFYRRDRDAQMEFTGENLIEHTPSDERVRVYTGNAFDLVGERRQISYKVDHSKQWLDETFEIKIRNHKKEPATVRVVEHLYRWYNWTIANESQRYQKTDHKTIEFEATLAAGQEKTISYLAHYTW